MGILDFLTGNDAGASPWGALYQQPAPKTFIDYSMGYPVETPVSPFGDPSRSSVGNPAIPPPPAPPATGFGAGATPFGFAGPGSNVVDPSQIAPPSPIGPPAPPAAAPATDLSSVNRPPAPQEPDSMVPVGKYQMPMFGEAPETPEQPTRQPAAPVITGGTTAPAPFSLGGAGSSIGDRLMKGTSGFLGNMAGGPISALAGGLGALVTGRSTDPASIEHEKLTSANNATAQALLGKGASAPDVAASLKNQALMKALVDQYYGKDKWNVVKVGEDNGVHIYKQQNQVDGTLRDIPGVAGAGGPVSNFVTGPDGRQIPIPAGVDRKEFIKQVTHANADAATGKATEAQAKASSFAARMTQAEGVLGGLQNEGLSLGNKVAGEVPVAGNYLQSKDYQRYKQASSAFITALLRQESGAAINKSEFDRYEKELFPQPGDDASVVTQKAAQRAAAIQQMSRAAGPGYQRPPAGGTILVGGQAVNWSVK